MELMSSEDKTNRTAMNRAVAPPGDEGGEVKGTEETKYTVK